MQGANFENNSESYKEVTMENQVYKKYTVGENVLALFGAGEHPLYGEFMGESEDGKRARVKMPLDLRTVGEPRFCVTYIPWENLRPENGYKD